MTLMLSVERSNCSHSPPVSSEISHEGLQSRTHTKACPRELSSKDKASPSHICALLSTVIEVIMLTTL